MKKKFLIGVLLFLALVFSVSANPIITVPGPVSVNENQQLQLVLSATAADNGTTTFSTDATFGALAQQNQTVATFTWIPGYADSGVHVVNFTVTDGNSSSTGSTAVTVVNVNRAPTITSSAVDTAEIDNSYYYNVQATDADGDTLTYSLLQGPNGMSIDSDDGELRWTPNATTLNSQSVQVQVSDGALTAAQSFTITVLAMEIDELEVVVADDDDRLDDGDTFDAKPGDSLSFTIVIKNLFSGDDDEDEVDIENVEITITVEEWDGRHDEEWDSDKVDIRYDDEETFEIDLGEIPGDIDDGYHDIIIEVVGEDENNQDHEITWTVRMDVEKNREDIRIVSKSLQPSTVSCSRNPLLSVKLKNYGTRDSDEIAFEAKNNALGISIQDYDIDLDEGDSQTLEYPLHLMSDVGPGTYSIRVSSFFDLRDFDDDDVSDNDNVILTVQSCAPVDEGGDDDEPIDDDDEVEVITPPPTAGVIIPVTTVEPEETGFSTNNLYMVMLVLLNVVVFLLILFLILKLATR